MSFTRACQRRCVGDRALLDLRHARRNADHDARVADMPRTVVCLGDEVLDHLLGVIEVGDHAVAQRPQGDDVGRRAAQHSPGFGADAQHLARALAHGHDRRLVENDAAPTHVHERVGRAEVDADVGRPDPQHGGEQVQGAWRACAKTGGWSGSYT